ncbi:Pvstp1, putative [Plasmodium vivax]|uniref:Pvstp1, putative n=1 Tax=Plasmodium vivax TaxID=5855 RepID=A0A1G4E6T5_PLAVI|nr:Pvstp1, putative [Plasmodium vivax]
MFKFNVPISGKIKKTKKYKEISRRFIYALVEYYTTFKNHGYTTDTHRKCRGLNYFLDDLRDEFNKHIVPLLSLRTKENYWNREVEEKLLKNLQTKTGNSCARNAISYNKEIRILRKEIEDYCDDKAELIGTLSSLNINEHEKCERFRYWMIDSLVNFWNDYYWRKYITYRSMIEPFLIDHNCDVVTLFDSPFQCERGRTFREHIPAHIRHKYKPNDEYVPPANIVPKNKKDVTILQSKTATSYVEQEYKENKNYDIPELGEAPIITDTLYFNNISTTPNSKSIKDPDKENQSLENVYRGIQRSRIDVTKPIDKQKIPAILLSLQNSVVSPASIPVASSAVVHSQSSKNHAVDNSLAVVSARSPQDKNIQTQTSAYQMQNSLHTRSGRNSTPTENKSKSALEEDTSMFQYSSVIPVLVGFITVIFLLSKYTSFGLLFGNKKKERHHKKLQEIRLKPTHLEKTSNIIEHDNLEDTKHEMYDKYIMYRRGKRIYTPKKKRNLKKTIIDIHLEVLDECQKDQWELNKRDFQEIILDEFMKDANIVCSHSSYNDSIITNMCNSEEIGKEKTLWVNWIERNKGTLEECKNEIWFNMLKSEWKQEQYIYLQKIEESEQSQLNEKKNIPLIEMQKDIWRQWVAKQHKLMEMYSEKDWFMHLLKCVEEEPNELETENSNEKVSLINLDELEKQKLYQQLYKKKQLIAKLWILILSLVVEECENEDNINDKELYLDSFLQNLKPKRCSGEKRYNSEKTCESNDIFEGNKNDETEKYKNEELFCKLNDDCINDDDDTCILANKNELDKSELMLENDTSLFNEDINKIPKDNVQMESTEDNSESDFLNVSTNNEQKFEEEYKQNINVI